MTPFATVDPFRQQERKLEGSSVNQALCAIRLFYRHHLGRNWDIWKKIRIHRSEPLPHVLTRGEVALLLRTFRDGRYRAYFTVVYQCGLRLSEAIHIKPKHIDGERLFIRIPKGKGGKAREVPITPELLQRLRTFWKAHRNPEWLCDDCSRYHFSYHSCNHRNCPQCGALDQQLWSARQEARLLPVPYFMVTFTLPSELRALCLAFPKQIYNLLLQESAGALSEVIATKRGGTCGITSVLHTWGRQLQYHPHVHCIVPAIAFDPREDHIIHPDRDDFLVHYKPLAERFRNRLRKALQEKHPRIHDTLTREQVTSLGVGTTWNVQLQPAGRGTTAIRYLARYVTRSAFSPKRLLGYDRKGRVRLLWICSNTGRSSVLTLSPHEFIRRWLLHVLPKGFTRVRHYGWLSSAAKKTLSRIGLLLGASPASEWREPQREPFTCSHCEGNLRYLRELERLPEPRAPPEAPLPLSVAT